MDRNLALELVRVTEAGAIEAAKWIGRGDKNAADEAAVKAIRKRFNQISFKGKVVIGEGEKDKAPMLYNDEIVGKSSYPEMDLAVDPLECTSSVAYGRYNAMSVIATGKKGTLLSAPDTYMEKIAVGKESKNVIDIDAPVEVNLKKIAKAKNKDIKEVVVMVLDRERHLSLIKEIRKVGSRVRLISDGDISSAIATCFAESGIDVAMGIGGSTEAVLAAVAVKILGGEILCRFKPKTKEDEKKIYQKTGLKNYKKIFSSDDLAKGKELSFTATGVIDGPLLKGVVFAKDKIITHSLIIRGISGTIRYLTTYHHYYQ